MDIEVLKTKKIGFISLGCDKNRVDLEKMIFNIKNAGLEIVADPKIANIIIINTCSFLESSRLESIENIVEMSEYKGKSLEKLIVTGCINELGYADLSNSLPEVDAFVNIKDNDKIVSIIGSLYKIGCNYTNTDGRILTTPSHYAYLKISEGCNNFCTYCLIPYIRGRYRSTPMEDLVKESQELANKGVTEIILVAQDITKYGVDLYKKKSLVDLIKKISSIEKIKWIRLLYCYPEEIDDDLINEIRTNDKVLKYIDIPLQHISDPVLKAMNRRSRYLDICNLIEKLKSNIPSIVIRTTFILGFPGETEEDFNLIIEFLKKYKLQNVGFFKYSREEGTRAYDLPNQISEEVKQSRLDKVSQEQYLIQDKLNNDLLNNVYDVIIDYVEDNISYGRYYGQCPDIDANIFINEKLEIGQIYKIKIINKFDYDLEGVRV